MLQRLFVTTCSRGSNPKLLNWVLGQHALVHNTHAVTFPCVALCTLPHICGSGLCLSILGFAVPGGLQLVQKWPAEFLVDFNPPPRGGGGLPSPSQLFPSERCDFVHHRTCQMPDLGIWEAQNHNSHPISVSGGKRQRGFLSIQGPTPQV